jgi:hypothetical protein
MIGKHRYEIGVPKDKEVTIVWEFLGFWGN